MTTMPSQMEVEAREAAAAVAAQNRALAPAIETLVADLRARPPRFVVTCGRGTSDHAGTFAKYLIETRLGLVTASAAPSVTSVYRSAPRLEDALVIAVSQSGRSPDLVDYARAARDAGAHVAALVNTAGSPLEDVATHVLPLGAGPERSVAATKSFLCSLSALIHLTGHWAGDAPALEALDGLPALLRQAASRDWGPITALGEARNLFVGGRGTGFAVALEAALKLKETCGLHAEAISSAEVQHGPMALVGAGFPVLFLAQNDESAEGTRALAERFRARGASVLVAGPPELDPDLPIAMSPDPACTAASLIQSFYLAAAGLARARGFDPDVPPHLAKVTETR